MPILGDVKLPKTLPAVFASDLPLVARTEPLPTGELGVRALGRQLAIAPTALTWATQRGILNGGRLLATLELHPQRAAQELGWTKEDVARAVRQLQDLFSRGQ